MRSCYVSISTLPWGTDLHEYKNDSLSITIILSKHADATFSPSTQKPLHRLIPVGSVEAGRLFSI